MGRFVEATVRGLQHDQIAVVRIAAVRAIWGFCSFLRLKKPSPQQQLAVNANNSHQRSLLLPVLPATVDALINMCTAFNWSTEILALVLETLTMVLACDPAFTATVESKAGFIFVQVFRVGLALPHLLIVFALTNATDDHKYFPVLITRFASFRVMVSFIRSDPSLSA